MSVKVQVDGSTVIQWTISTISDSDTLADVFISILDVGECVGGRRQKQVHRLEPTAAYIGTSRTNTARAAVDIEKLFFIPQDTHHLHLPVQLDIPNNHMTSLTVQCLRLVKIMNNE